MIFADVQFQVSSAKNVSQINFVHGIEKLTNFLLFEHFCLIQKKSKCKLGCDGSGHSTGKFLSHRRFVISYYKYCQRLIAETAACANEFSTHFQHMNESV